MAERFNIDRFMDASGKVELSDIDWAAVSSHPITPEAVRTLRYFLVTERSTFFYTRALMQTNMATRGREFAPFIAAWTYEEEFHGRAFHRFLEAYGERVDEEQREQLFFRRRLGERVDELGQVLLSYAFSDSWPAVHMVWGTIQELTTYMAYQALIDRVDHPVLSVICQRIMKQELRHYAFYREQARRWLIRPAAQRLVNAALRIGWTPVGDGMCAKRDVCHAVSFLFDGTDGTAIPSIEAKVRELPGLGWFDLFSQFARQHGIRRAPAAWMPRAALRSESSAAASA